jgi:hypothetical protein
VEAELVWTLTRQPQPLAVLAELDYFQAARLCLSPAPQLQLVAAEAAVYMELEPAVLVALALETAAWAA